MDIQRLKYAVEVERLGSISKAAEKLFMSQPSLSKAIRELENDIGISIFNRSSRGVLPTKKGAEFLARASEILANVEDLEQSYKEKPKTAYRFQISVPIACYISHAFVEFIKALGTDNMLKADYRETNTMSAINHVVNQDCNLAIIRYQMNYEDYYQRYVESKDLLIHPLWKFKYHLVVSKDSPLAGKECVTESDLRELVQISHGDPTVPSLSASAMLELRKKDADRREIVVYERQSQFELLCALPQTYMWASPTPRSVLETYPLVEKSCPAEENTYQDILIYRKGYRLTQKDKLFIEKVDEVIKELTKN